VLPKAEREALLHGDGAEHHEEASAGKLARGEDSAEPAPAAAAGATDAAKHDGDSGKDYKHDEKSSGRGGFTYDPLFKAKAAARAKAAERREAAASATEKDKEVAKKQKARKVKARQYAKRSTKGQPLMATRMKDLLGKIQQRSGQ